MKKLHVYSIVVIVGFLTLVGCKLFSPKLDTGGVYAGQSFLYTTDQTIATSYDTLDGFLSWALQNKVLLHQKSPEIIKAADTIQTNAPQWFQAALSARAAYVQLLSQTNALPGLLNAASNNLVAQVTVLQASATSAKTLSTSVTTSP